MCTGRAFVLWVLCLYALSQFAITTFMNSWRPGPFDSIWHGKRKQFQALLADAPDASLVLMLGSSRTDGSFQAGRVKDMPGPDGRPVLGYNLGVPAAGPLHEWLYLRPWLDQGVRPRLLLVELLPLLLNEQRRPFVSEESWTEMRWLHLSQLARLWPYFHRPRRKGGEWLEGCMAPAYAFRQELHGDLIRWLKPGEPPSNDPFDRDEWGYGTPPWFSAEERARLLRCTYNQVGATLNNLRLGQGPCQAVRDMLDRCRAEGVRVAFVVMPESSLYRSWYSPQTRARLQQFQAELRQTYGVDIIDANCWLPDEYFADGHHVLPPGADAFSIRLRGEIQRLLR